MRPVYILIVILLAFPILIPVAAAQSNPTQYVTLYAHSTAGSLFLNALPQWGSGQKMADVSGPMTFKLVPTLGEPLRIYGTITFTVYLQASSAMIGDLIVELTELKPTGSEMPVSGARIDAPVSLDTRATPITLGVGIIDYQFSKGSSMVLRLLLNRLSVSGAPYLVWDSPATPTNLRLPASDDLKTQLAYSGRSRSFDKILQSNQNGTGNLTIVANVTDAIGSYRLTSDSQFILISPNGTTATLTPSEIVPSPYTKILSSNTSLEVGEWQIKTILHDVTGNSYEFDDTIWIVPFNHVSIYLSDASGAALTNTTVNVSTGSTIWTNETDSLGLVTFNLPSSTFVGQLNMTVIRNSISVQNTTLDSDIAVYNIKLNIYNLNLRVTVSGLPIMNAEVDLLRGENIIAQGSTNLYGETSFTQIPPGNYILHVHYLLGESDVPLNMNTPVPTVIVVNFPLPQAVWLIVATTAVIGAVTTIQLDRRRRKTFPTPFNYFGELTSGGLPKTCFAVIAGDSGSGKSALLESIAGEHLKITGCVYITNVEYPSKIREDMVNLGVVPTNESFNQRMIFIDAYAAVGGAQSREEFHVSSLTDLTALGLQISQGLERLGLGADVYLDSLNPLINALRVDYLLNFLQSIAAKVKANQGKLCVTIGTAIAKSDLTKLEENSDCIIETHLQESGKGQRRRLRVKKLRGKAYVDRWTQFQIESGKGVVFYITKKAAKQSRLR